MNGAAEETVGFVGTGTISAAIIRGLLKGAGSNLRILVSPRNAELASALAAEHPEVHVAADNQAVVDGSGLVFLAVRPQVAEDVIPDLTFRKGQCVVSLIAATERARLLGWIDAEVDLVQAIPLPFVENREGVTALFPGNARVEALFNSLGTAVPCTTRKEYDLLAAASATMALFFGHMGRMVEWLEEQGLPEDSGRAYMSAHFQSLAKVAVQAKDIPLQALAREYATKGGLNEQVWTDFDQQGGTAAAREALDRVLKRITK